MDIGPEPSTEVFQAVMAGSDERTINGEAVCIADELPFAGLRKFGAPFLSKFQVVFAWISRLSRVLPVDVLNLGRGTFSPTDFGWGSRCLDFKFLVAS